jgi:hypothetical protein
MTPKKRVTAKAKKMDYGQISDEYAVLASDSHRTLKRIAIVIALAIVLFASYHLVRNLVSPKPKVFIKMFDKIALDYKPTTVKAINNAAVKENHIPLQIKIIAKPNPYKNVYGEQDYRDYVVVSMINPYNQEIGKVFVKLKPNKDGFYEGIANYTFSKTADKDNTLNTDVVIMLTNKQRAADMIPVRVKISE